MSKRVAKPAKVTSALPTDYAPLLADIKARVQTARIKAGLAVNRELLALYWDIGRLIGRARDAGLWQASGRTARHGCAARVPWLGRVSP